MAKHDATVYVVDDDKSVRDALGWLIGSVDLPVKTFASAAEFLDSYEPEDHEGCLVVDVRMPGMSGIELQRKLASGSSVLPIIIVTGHGHVDMAVGAMKAGAFDFIEKPFDEQVLLDIVQKAVRKSARDARARHRQAEIRRRLEMLSPRESEVLKLILRGEPNKRIAFHLDICEKTVEAHRARIMEKMQAKSLTELVKLCVKIEPYSGNP
jgi:two-component system response regulator FixJ